MDKITDKIAALPHGANYFSLEFFPPKTSMGSSNLRARLDRMARGLRPLFVTVTWGAGGTTSAKSLELAELCQCELGLTTCLHLTCTNMSPSLVDKALDQARMLGIRNILALRGDPPRRDEYLNDDEHYRSGDRDTFEWAIDLVRYIRKKYGDFFCIGVAAYPEGHADQSHPADQSLEHDLPYLVQKVQAGADFIMTQLFFDVAAYNRFERMLREHKSGVFGTIPIIPGLMPIQSYQILRRTTKLSHAKLPEAILKRFDEVRSDDEMVKKVGIDVVSEIVEAVKTLKNQTARPQGFHFYTLNLEKAVAFILERTHLIPDDSSRSDETAGLSIMEDHSTNQRDSIQPDGPLRRQSPIGSDPHNRVISEKSHPSPLVASAADAGLRKELTNSRANTLAISEGEGTLGREATWDDFPNGRWGDARSPAYGEIDGYGVSLHMSVSQATRLWGYPTTVDDLNTLFIRHIEGKLSAVPWGEDNLNEETATILPQLLQLNRRGWWTLASQPAVNGMRSSDSIFGWGPRNGFVFQKAFVELFLSTTTYYKVRDVLSSTEDISFLASNAAGAFESSDNGTSTNAVTWGVFPSKEIITPTIIEKVSFSAWAEEAFSIWDEWARVYPSQSPSSRLLVEMKANHWLVVVIHHNYMENDALWDLLLSV